MAGSVSVKTVNIGNNTALSSELDLEWFQISAFILPTTFTGTTITFQAKTELLTKAATNPQDPYYNVYDSAGTELSMTVAGNRCIVPTAALAAALAPLRRVRLRCGTSGSPVTQSPEQLITVLLKSN